MRKLLLLVPKGNGPGLGKRWNLDWPDKLENAVGNNLWKLVTPGVLVLAALTGPYGYDVDLVDEEFQEVDRDKSYDIVAMYTVTPNAKRAYQWAEYYRSLGTYVVLGGVHAMMCEQEAGEYADTLLLGEAEYIWTRFLGDFEQGCAERKYVQPIGEVDINKSPIPAFEFLPEKGRKLIPIQTARGCPHGCYFCNMRSLYGSGYRAKTLENVRLELERIIAINPRATVYFTDDNLFCNKERSTKLLGIIKGFGLIWYANSDISLGQDERLLKMAYNSGCRQVLIGFESVNPENLKGIDENGFKEKSFQGYRDCIKRIQSNGIGVVGSFILGLDGDDSDIFDRMIEFVRDTNMYGVSITMNTPYPGTMSYHKYLEENRILTFDWDMYTIFQPVIEPKLMTVKELNDGYIRVLQEINSQDNVFRRLRFFKEQLKNLKGY